LFDLVIPPEHDQLTGPNVFPIVGAPNRLTPQRLTDDHARFSGSLNLLPAPRIAVAIGGRSKAHDLSPARARAMGAEIAAAVRAAGGSVMVTFSRRTPPEAETELKAAL